LGIAVVLVGLGAMLAPAVRGADLHESSGTAD